MKQNPDVQARFLAYLKPNAKILILGLICAAVTAGITVGVAGFIKIAFDAMEEGNARNLGLLCLGVVGIFLVKGVFSFGQSYFLSLVSNRVAAKLRDEIFAHLQKLSLSFFNRRRTGNILSTITGDVPVLQEATMSVKDAVSAPLTIIISLISLFVISWRLGLVSLVFIPFMALIISRISKRIRTISREVQERLADITTISEETVSGVRIIKSFSAEEVEVARFEERNHSVLKSNMRSVRKNAQLRPLTEFIGAFGIALVLFMGGSMVAETQSSLKPLKEKWIDEVVLPARRQHLNIPKEPNWKDPKGGLTLGGLIAFVYLLNTLSRSAGDIGSLFTLRARAFSAAKRIFDEVLDVESEVAERESPVVLPSIQGYVRFENVSFQYNSDGEKVLKNINFEVKPGEVVAVVGKTGSGKSTLVDLIPRFYDPTEGRILVDGVDIREVKLDSLRRQIGIVPQETWLFAGTLRHNIAYGKPDATDEEVRSAAYAANASSFIDGPSMPQRYDTIVGERGIRLSGGERQRIAIARAILMNPRLLILDEATSSLDASSEALVKEALDTLMKGRTTIVIAHRLSTIMNADRILVMSEGKIIEAGSHRDLIGVGGAYARLYETQLQGLEE